MPRVTVTLPNDLHTNLSDYAKSNDEPLSNVIAKMADLGYMVKKTQSQKSSSNLSETEEHCSKLIIQMNAIIKDFAEKKLGYDLNKFNLLRDKSIERYNELAGIKKEEL